MQYDARYTQRQISETELLLIAGYIILCVI